MAKDSPAVHGSDTCQSSLATDKSKENRPKKNEIVILRKRVWQSALVSLRGRLIHKVIYLNQHYIILQKRCAMEAMMQAGQSSGRNLALHCYVALLRSWHTFQLALPLALRPATNPI